MIKVFKHFAWWLNHEPRFYQCDPAKPFRFSEKRLIQLFYLWRKEGVEALVLKYRSGRPKIEAGKVHMFALACLSSGICSLRQAHATMSQPGQTVHGYRHALPVRQRKAIIELLAARRIENRLEKRVRRLLGVL